MLFYIKKIVFLFLLFGYLVSKAQSPKLLLELNPTANSYAGDLGDAFSKWGGGVQANLFFYPKKGKIGAAFGLGYSTISGQEISILSQNLTNANEFFKTQLIHFQGEVRYLFLSKKYLKCYVAQGIGLLRFQAYDAQEIALYDQASTRAADETYSPNTIIFPSSVGLLYFFKTGFGAGIQLGLLNPTSDYLDNISKLSNKTNNLNDNVLQIKTSFIVPLSFRKNNS